MTEDTPLPFELPVVEPEKASADFAVGPILSDGGPVGGDLHGFLPQTFRATPTVDSLP